MAKERVAMRWSIHASWSGEKGGLDVWSPGVYDDEEPPPANGAVEVDVAGVVVITGAPVDAAAAVEEDEVAISARMGVSVYKGMRTQGRY